ncbi:MAG: HDOD domain-containing protein [Opitutaceae bacterium]
MPNPLASPATAQPSRRDEAIRRKLDGCPKLASLQSINKALTSLVNSEGSLTSQIAEIIRRDPSLTARLLRMVNSVYFGLSANISSVEEAVFFLGLRQIRELSRATPVIEDLERLQSSTSISRDLWKSLWNHSIGTAILTREILASAPVTFSDEIDYLVGLLHNLGKILMAYCFPDELMTVAGTPLATAADACALERELIGWDHAQIAGYYLERHHLTEELIFAVRYHHQPEAAPRHQCFAAAVQVADQLARHAGIESGFEKLEPAGADSWMELSGWKILYGQDEAEWKIARASLASTLQRLPGMLSGMV